MSNRSPVLAVVFDFDDTLVPDSTSKLLLKHGIDADKFWKTDAKALVANGYDPAHAYLKLILDNIGKNKRLGVLRNADLRKFGRTLDADFFPGLPRLFNDLRKLDAARDVTIEYYIISGGLQEIVAGSEVVQRHFKAVYGCQLAGDAENGVLRHIKRCVTFTEKTRYLFEINKGLDAAETQKNPVLVNSPVPAERRRVPFKNMIYVGDGLTDIPCFSLLKSQGGTAFGVFDPSQEKSAKQALQEFLKPDRVVSVHAPKYRKRDELGALLRAAVATRCSQIKLEQAQADRSGS